MAETDTVTGDSTARPFYNRVAIAGLTTIVVTMAVLFILQLGLGDTSNVAFVIINFAIAGIVAGLVWRFGSWALVLGAIAGLLGVVVVYGLYLVEAAGSVNSVFDFGLAVVATVASFIALLGSIVAFVQLRRGNPRVESTAVERNTLWAVTAVVAVIVVLSGVLTLAARDTVEESERVGAIEVLMKRTEFKTAQLNSKSGETMRLVLKNDDLYIHTFTIEELDIDVTVGPRGEKALELTPSNAGTFEYICTITGHESMTGTLNVT